VITIISDIQQPTTVTAPQADQPVRRSGPLRPLLGDEGDGLLLVLNAVTGVVGAISILSLGWVFVANMTGNVVLAGFAAVGAPGFSLSTSLFALAGFASMAAEFVLVAAAPILAASSGAPGVSYGAVAITGSAFGPGITDALACSSPSRSASRTRRFVS